jgi:hypothetical protein
MGMGDGREWECGLRRIIITCCRLPFAVYRRHAASSMQHARAARAPRGAGVPSPKSQPQVHPVPAAAAAAAILWNTAAAARAKKQEGHHPVESTMRIIRRTAMAVASTVASQLPIPLALHVYVHCAFTHHGVHYLRWPVRSSTRPSLTWLP